ncbi:MAG: methionine--tRNA ligase [Nanoarchaeota archaeon]|nr:methionine--tRNA ligase [Nanoarchaeota archaeon]
MANKNKVNKFYITTAIDYPSANPHLGHAYEKICADVIARWNRLKGKDVFFLTGTDEHGMKIQRAAEKQGKLPKEFVDEMAAKFQKLYKVLNISNDRFIRTTESEHERISQEIFEEVYGAGDVYKGKYEGFYCVDCETFYLEKDAPNLECPIHKKQLETIKEESYFFKMSKYEKQIIEHIEKNKDFILPEYKQAEILNRLKQGLKDLSVSRTSFSWGIPVPFDSKHVIYVWFDALINYLSGIDYGTKKFEKYWPADVHVIGKDILWHHSVIWPSMLLSAKIKLPKTILVHGFINLKGEKLSKSGGKVIDPIELAEKYGSDILRYYLLKDVVFGEDGDFSEQGLQEKNNELADKLGNLVSRLEGLAEKEMIKKCRSDKKLTSKLKFKEIQEKLDNYKLDKALHLITEFLDECNKYIQDEKIWTLEGETRNNALYTLVDSLRVTSIFLYPFIPETGGKILERLNETHISLERAKFELLDNISIKKQEILFKKL